MESTIVEPGRIRSYRDLQVWQLGMDLAEACYLLTKRFPKDELFGMTSQIRQGCQFRTRQYCGGLWERQQRGIRPIP